LGKHPSNGKVLDSLPVTVIVMLDIATFDSTNMDKLGLKYNMVDQSAYQKILVSPDVGSFMQHCIEWVEQGQQLPPQRGALDKLMSSLADKLRSTILGDVTLPVQTSIYLSNGKPQSLRGRRHNLSAQSRSSVPCLLERVP
jgi:hypothetical protein